MVSAAGTLGQLPERDRGDAVEATAATVLDQPVRRLGLDDRRVHPDPPRPHGDAKARPRTDPGRLDPGEVEVGEEVVGEGRPQGEIGDRLEGALARHVDLDLCADRAHGGAILCPRRRLAALIICGKSPMWLPQSRG